MTTTSLVPAVPRDAADDKRGAAFQADRHRARLARCFARGRAGGDRGGRNALVLQFMPFARRIAREYSAPSHREDVEQVAYLALVKAVDRFDPAHGNSFATFAGPTIAGEIKNYFRDHSWDLHVPRRLQDRALRARRVRSELQGELGRAPRIDEIAGRLDTDAKSVLQALIAADARDTQSLDWPVDRGDSEGPETTVLTTRGMEDQGFARVIDRAALRDALARLTDQERQVLGLRFLAELSQAEIAARMGVSQMQVSRLLRRATERTAQPTAEPTVNGSETDAAHSLDCDVWRLARRGPAGSALRTSHAHNPARAGS